MQSTRSLPTAKDWECLNRKALAFLRLVSIRLNSIHEKDRIATGGLTALSEYGKENSRT